MRRWKATPARVAGALMAVVLLTVSACSGSSSGTGSTGDAAKTTTAGSSLRLAFSSDMDPPDPDTNYQLQGNQVTTALYEGLVDYAPDSTSKIVPLLAESWTVSPDQLTYTFKIRTGVTFHDGTPLDASSFKAGFDRRNDKAIGSPMSYMLLPVDTVTASDPTTLVIKLKYAESAFLTYLASPFSPKAISPTFLAAHPDDLGVEALKTASAGTGPYQLTEFKLGQRYVLTRFDKYWGDKPFYEKVEISIIPDAATQVLQLQGGDLDIISSQPIATVKTFKSNDKFQVVTFPVLQKAWIHVNTQRAPFDDVAVRTAVRSAIDKKAITTAAWDTYASVSTQLYPVQNLPDGKGTDTWSTDASKLKAVASGTSIELAYAADRPADQQVVETIQSQLEAAGLKVTLVPTQEADLSNFQENPATAPHLYYEVSYPDSSHPDTWSRLFWFNDIASGAGGFLNYRGAGTKAGDDAMNTGLGATDDATVVASYDASAKEVFNQVGYITIADPQDVFIARAGLSGFAHWLPTPLTLQLKALKG